MALFYFILRAGRQRFADPEGEEFADIAGARAHAEAVAGDLMRNRETKTGHWCIEVCDDYLQPCYECLFADTDQWLEKYDEVLRSTFRQIARSTAGLNRTLRDIDVSMHDLRQTMQLLAATEPGSAT